MIGRAEFQLQELRKELESKTFIFDRERKTRKFLKEGTESILNIRIRDLMEIDVSLQLILVGEREQSYTVSLDRIDRDRLPMTKSVVIYLAGLLLLTKRLSSKVAHLTKADIINVRVILMDGRHRFKNFIVEARKDANDNFNVTKSTDS